MREKITPKARTIRAILKHLIWAIVIFTIILVTLSYFGLNILPLLTGAGLFGLALSLGAQSLVKDFIAGFFIFVENQYNIGDHVKIGDLKGQVYNITLRITVLMDKDENLVYIPNSVITSVTKYKKS